jgi:membrane dipeptidase
MDQNPVANPSIFDGHNDTLLRIYKPKEGERRSFFEASEIGHLDLPRARAGGLGGGFFALFVPKESDAEVRPAEPAAKARLADPVGADYARRFAVGLAASMFKIEAESNGRVRIVRNVDELAHCLETGVLAMVMHFEGAEAFDPNLDALHVYYQAGLRSLGIVWSRPNAFGTGVPFRFPSSPDTGPGLTPLGEDLVRTCNQLGVMLDVSHLNEAGFWDVARLTDAPLVATHSNAHTLCASSRNLTDKQLDAIGDTGGMVGVNFHVRFLRQDGVTNAETPMAEIANQIDYIADRIGIDHVGFGSDFDGATMPHDLGDVTGMPGLMDLLRERGYDEAALRKIAHENWLRVLRATWKEGT